ncbi:ArsR/SmtB family transcription factor [Desulfotomaculum copahuensis]
MSNCRDVLSWEECQQVSEFLQGFSNPVRLKVLCTLHDHEKSVGEIAALLNAKPSNISQQLKILMSRGYVSKRREERNVYYSIRSKEIYDLLEYLRLLAKEQT